LGDIDDVPGNSGALIVIAAACAALVDQYDHGFNALPAKLRNKRVDGFRVILEFEPRRP
jgi:hypothetical protein